MVNNESKPLISKGGSVNGDDDAPNDTFNLVYITFFLLGAGFLFPWNAIITAVDYWALIYSPAIIFKFTVAYMVPNLCGLIFVVLWGPKLPAAFRIIGGYLMFITVVVLVMIIHHPVVAVVLICMLGFCDAVVQGTTYGLAGQFPPKFVGAVMAGNGISGVTICALRIVTKLSAPQDAAGIKESAFVYFIVSLAALVLCIVAYFGVIMRSPFAKYYQVHSLSEDATKRPAASILADARSIFKHIWLVAIMVGFIFFVTLGLFPGITSQMISTHKALNTGEWFPIILTTIFNVGDLIGRTAPQWIVLFNEKTVAVPIILRVAFFPLIMLCLHPKIFISDIWMYVFMAVFAITNGYLSTICMMVAPTLVEPKLREVCGTIMVFFLTIGLTSGVVFGLILDKVYLT